MPDIPAIDPGCRAKAELLLLGVTDADAALLGARLTAEHDGDTDQMLAAAWLMGAQAYANTLAGRRICRICGCWELQACEGGCSWKGPALCSACTGEDLREEGAFWGDGDGDPFPADDNFPPQFDDAEAIEASQVDTSIFMAADEAARLQVDQEVVLLCGGCGENDDNVQAAFEPGASARVYDIGRDHTGGLQLGVVIIAEGEAAGISNVFDSQDFDGRYPFKIAEAV